MALFTDGAISGLEDLQHYENSVLDIAATEGIDLTAKLSLAQDELANQILLYILRHPIRDTKAAVRRSVGLGDVVSTGPLKKWHALTALAMIYRDAYNNQLNDRYLGKWNEYQQLAQAAATDYLQLGVGVVADPIIKPAGPALSAVAGSGPGGTYFVAISWVNTEGQEGTVSDVQSETTDPGMQLQVSPLNPPANAAGWNLYAGAGANNLALQNALPISIGRSWTLGGVLASGTAPSEGQAPERFLVHDRLLQRG